MIEIKIRPISPSEYSDLMRLPTEHVYRKCCTTIGDGINCESPEIVCKISISGWITNEPFYVCRRCIEDYVAFGQITLRNHSTEEVLHASGMRICPYVRDITLRFNEVSAKLRLKEIISKTTNIKKIEALV